MRGIVVLGEGCVPPTIVTTGNALKADSVPTRGLTGVTVGAEDPPTPHLQYSTQLVLVVCVFLATASWTILSIDNDIA